MASINPYASPPKVDPTLDIGSRRKGRILLVVAVAAALYFLIAPLLGLAAKLFVLADGPTLVSPALYWILALMNLNGRMLDIACGALLAAFLKRRTSYAVAVVFCSLLAIVGLITVARAIDARTAWIETAGVAAALAQIALLVVGSGCFLSTGLFLGQKTQRR